MVRNKIFFIKINIKNPYPKYNNIIKIIKNKDRKIYMDIFAKYTKDNHK